MIRPDFFSARSLALGWSLLILVVLCVPGDGMNHQVLPFPHADKLVHFSLFGFYAYLWGRASIQKGIRLTYNTTLIFISGTAYGIALECLQELPAIARTFDYHDMMANSAGCFLIYFYRFRK